MRILFVYLKRTVMDSAVQDVGSQESLYKAEFCCWNDLSYSDCERLLDVTNNNDQTQTTIRAMLKLDDVAMETDSQIQVATDLYASAVVFARKNNFSPLQLSTLISILKRVHNACILTPFDNLDSTMKMFQELMVKHSVERPPYSESVFSIAQVKAITDYILSSYFKHYKLYKFAFTKKVRLDLIFVPQLSESRGTGVQETQLEDKEGSVRGIQYSNVTRYNSKSKLFNTIFMCVYVILSVENRDKEIEAAVVKNSIEHERNVSTNDESTRREEQMSDDSTGREEQITDDYTGREKQTGNESIGQEQMGEKQAKLATLIDSSISGKLHQLQVHNLLLRCVV